MEPNELIGSRLRRARKRAGVEQRELASELGVNRRTMTNWERGDTVPSAAQLRQICLRLGCSADWLLHGGKALIDRRGLQALLDADRLSPEFYEQLALLGTVLTEDAEIVDEEGLRDAVMKASVQREYLERKSGSGGTPSDQAEG